MKRLQINIDEGLYESLRDRAFEKRISISELLRQTLADTNTPQVQENRRRNANRVVEQGKVVKEQMIKEGKIMSGEETEKMEERYFNPVPKSVKKK